MRLTLHTDYALRLLMLLALEPEALHTVDAVARRYGISRNHLTKVAQTLVHAGFIDSLRGRGGGLRLAGPPAGVSLGAVIRATEEDFAVVECFDGGRNRCVVAPACGLRAVLSEALTAFLAVLDRYSLEDLVGDPARHRRLLGLLAAAAA